MNKGMNATEYRKHWNSRREIKVSSLCDGWQVRCRCGTGVTRKLLSNWRSTSWWGGGMRSDEEGRAWEEGRGRENSRTRQKQSGVVGKGCFLAARMQRVVGAKRRHNDAKWSQMENRRRNCQLRRRRWWVWKAEVEWEEGKRMRSRRASIVVRGWGEDEVDEVRWEMIFWK